MVYLPSCNQNPHYRLSPLAGLVPSLLWRPMGWNPVFAVLSFLPLSLNHQADWNTNFFGIFTSRLTWQDAREKPPSFPVGDDSLPLLAKFPMTVLFGRHSDNPFPGWDLASPKFTLSAGRANSYCLSNASRGKGPSSSSLFLRLSSQMFPVLTIPFLGTLLHRIQFPKYRLPHSFGVGSFGARDQIWGLMFPKHILYQLATPSYLALSWGYWKGTLWGGLTQPQFLVVQFCTIVATPRPDSLQFHSTTFSYYSQVR